LISLPKTKSEIGFQASSAGVGLHSCNCSKDIKKILQARTQDLFWGRADFKKVDFFGKKGALAPIF